MNTKFLLFTFASFFFLPLVAQKEFEYLGVLKIKDTTLISYRLKLMLVGQEVKGYSVTNIGGPHETKSYVKGKYYPEKNTLVFNEYGIEYTKSDLQGYDFCFVHFTGKVKKLNKQDVIEGVFEGNFSDGVSCISGELMVRSIEKIYARAEKTDRKIQRLKIVPDSVKNKVSLKETIDEKRINLIKASEKTSILCKSDKIIITIWDAGKIDGDKISIFYNDKLLIKNYLVDGTKKTFQIPLVEKTNTFKIIAENTGSISPNTARIIISDGERDVEMFSNLKEHEETTLILHKA